MPKNVFHQHYDVSNLERASLLGQTGCVLWFSGLSGAGKSTLANALEKRLLEEKRLSYVLDGDNLRCGLNSDLDFTEAGRTENLRRVAEVAKLFADAGTICISAFISPLIVSRQAARAIVGEERFFEVYIATSLEACEKRDRKGLYKRARAGEIPNFTGIDSPFEAPLQPHLVIDTEEVSIDESVEQMFNMLLEKKVFSGEPMA